MNTDNKIINWNGLALTINDTASSIENEGRLSKLWVADQNNGRQYLIKSSGFYGYEPISEKLAYIIGSSLGFDVLKYDLIESEHFRGILKFGAGCKWLSICERLDINGYTISAIKNIKNAKNIGKNKEDLVTNRETMYNILDNEYINNMLIFDAIIGNTDRHYGNVHLLLDYSGNIYGAPLLDNGASLLATYDIFSILAARNNAYNLLNKSFTLEKTHDKQLIHVDSRVFKGINITEKILMIDDKIQSTLDLLPQYRRYMVERYIIARLHKYLAKFS